MIREFDLALGDGRTLHAYDAGPDGGLAVLWHHGTPNIGAPPAPLFPAAAEHGIRFVSYDRPGYGGSTPLPGRDVLSAVSDAAAVLDALGIDRFAALGHSGGGPPALACAALLPERVLGVVCVAGMAPRGAAGLDWFAGMGSSGAAELRAATVGPAALEDHLATHEFDEEMFTEADWAALAGEWSWFDGIVQAGLAAGRGGMVADDVANVGPWGFDPARIGVPALVVHGDRDRMVPSSHGRWLAGRIPGAQLWLLPDDGHISVLSAGPAALGWLRESRDLPEGSPRPGRS